VSTLLDPAELLQSGRMLEVLAYCKEAEFVVIDGPPVLGVADSLALAPMVDGVIVVADAKRGNPRVCSHGRLPARPGGRPRCRRRPQRFRVQRGEQLDTAPTTIELGSRTGGRSPNPAMATGGSPAGRRPTRTPRRHHTRKKGRGVDGRVRARRQAAWQGAACLSRRGVDRFGNEGSAGDSKQSSDQELCSNRRAGQRAPRLTHVAAWMPLDHASVTVALAGSSSLKRSS
jgi:hypothetical protein